MKFMARFPPDTGSRWTRSGFIEHPSHTHLCTKKPAVPNYGVIAASPSLGKSRVITHFSFELLIKPVKCYFFFQDLCLEVCHGKLAPELRMSPARHSCACFQLEDAQP